MKAEQKKTEQRTNIANGDVVCGPVISTLIRSPQKHPLMVVVGRGRTISRWVVQSLLPTGSHGCVHERNVFW